MQTEQGSKSWRGPVVTAAVLTLGIFGPAAARAQVACDVPLASGLKVPLGLVLTDQRNLLVSESGDQGVLHSGRISIVSSDGARRTLLDGLPSASNDVNEPSGPAGIVMRGRTLYVALGIGDAILPVGDTPFRIGNPHPSSRLFSSILAIHFSAETERTTGGFSLTTADQEALANGDVLRLSNGAGETITIELIANFPDYVPNPVPPAPDNVEGSNPFGLALIADQLYVSDGARNLVWRTNLETGAFEPLARFDPIPNTTGVGGPILEAVPAGIRAFAGQVFVTLFRGFPFPDGVSSIERVDPRTGTHAPLVTGLRTAVDVLFDDEKASLFILQHTSGPLLPPFSGPGSLARWNGEGLTVLADCLNRPTAMVRDDRSGRIYISELNGRVVVVR
jgi:hypothetical protein